MTSEPIEPIFRPEKAVIDLEPLFQYIDKKFAELDRRLARLEGRTISEYKEGSVDEDEAARRKRLRELVLKD